MSIAPGYDHVDPDAALYVATAVKANVANTAGNIASSRGTLMNVNTVSRGDGTVNGTSLVPRKPVTNATTTRTRTVRCQFNAFRAFSRVKSLSETAYTMAGPTKLVKSASTWTVTPPSELFSDWSESDGVDEEDITFD